MAKSSASKKPVQYPHRCEATIVARRAGQSVYHFIYLPDAVAAELPLAERPRLRISGRLGNAAFDGAWMPGQGTWALMVSRRLLERSGYRAGERAMLWFRVESEQTVRLPEALAEALAANQAAAAAWAKLTPGRRRGWAYHVAQAKRAETAQRRIAGIFAELGV